MATDKSSELQERGFCVLKGALATARIDACREAFWPVLTEYLNAGGEANRGPQRHFLPMPFEAGCFHSDFFFHSDVLAIVHRAMDTRVVADQWGCDVPLAGSQYQAAHADYQRSLFAEMPDLVLPPYLLVVSFGLVRITADDGPIEIAPGTHRMARSEALRAVECGEVPLLPVLLEIGDVLIRHPWALHRGTPNRGGVPRALVTVRYVRRWYYDDSREVCAIPLSVWRGLTPEQQRMMRFPVGC